MPAAATNVDLRGKLLVRIKPYNKRNRCVLRSYTYSGTKFDEAKGWYTVDVDLAEHLREIPQVESDPTSPPAFDVCTYEEAIRLDDYEESAARREYERRLARDSRTVDRRGASSARDALKREQGGNVTTKDLPSNIRSRADTEAAGRVRENKSRYAEQTPEQETTLTTRDLHGEREPDEGGFEGDPAADDKAFDGIAPADIKQSDPDAKTTARQALPATVPKATRRAPARKPLPAPKPATEGTNE